ncbi:hypothetical protein, partial [Escherichia coli]|uniref:hypothetical protein n=1 Tax=Escherichia coli TaxID=562 RepID=UPI001BDBA392
GCFLSAYSRIIRKNEYKLFRNYRTVQSVISVIPAIIHAPHRMLSFRLFPSRTYDTVPYA